MTLEFFKALTVDSKLIKSVVGAGDSFLGGLIHGLVHQKEIEEAILSG